MADHTEHSPRWMRLDNAALIFPAAQRRRWSNAFRIAFTFTDPIDPDVLQRSLERIAPRFPSVVVRLRSGMFWHYLEELSAPPSVQADTYQPLRSMTGADVRRCAIRVLYYRNRMAVEFFHAVTDGTGGMVFAKSLAAEYVRRRYRVDVPCTDGVKAPDEAPTEDEFVDSFQENAGPLAAPRDDRNVYRAKGETEPDRFLHVTTGILDARQLLRETKSRGVTVTTYLTAVLLQSLMQMQAEDEPRQNRRRPVKVQIPVNLRQLYGGNTMRNFVAVANIGVDPRLGSYTFEELVQLVHHQMALAITEKNMRMIFTPNVRDERNKLLKIVPLSVKNIVMRLVFDAVGERVASLSLSNLGNVQLPDAMAQYVTRAEFILGAQATAPYNCSVTSWQDKTYVNIVRNSVQPRLEQAFFTALVRMGFHVKLESNDR